jgi:uncharacterized protein YciI
MKEDSCNMLYLVTAEWIESGTPTDKEEFLEALNRSILPSLEMLAAWEQEGTILAGGFFPGERSGAWIMEAASNEEIGEWISSLIFWGRIKWTVRALQSLTSTIEREHKVRRLLEARLNPREEDRSSPI